MKRSSRFRLVNRNLPQASCNAAATNAVRDGQARLAVSPFPKSNILLRPDQLARGPCHAQDRVHEFGERGGVSPMALTLPAK